VASDGSRDGGVYDGLGGGLAGIIAVRCSNRALKGLLELVGHYGDEPPPGTVAAALMDLQEGREVMLSVLACDKCKTQGLCHQHRGKLGRQTWEYNGKKT
jgi:hypothetical protein